MDGAAPSVRISGGPADTAGPRAWWSGNAAELIASDPDAIIDRLSVSQVQNHPANRETQLQAWRQQINLLQTALATCPPSWRVLIEYPLLRLGRRIDAIILTGRAIFVLAFNHNGVRGREQVEDNALDLQDFHAASRSYPIVPILVSETKPIFWPLFWHGVAPVMESALAGSASCYPRSIHGSHNQRWHSITMHGKSRLIARCRASL
jgi:hypothetical protein